MENKPTSQGSDPSDPSSPPLAAPLPEGSDPASPPVAAPEGSPLPAPPQAAKTVLDGKRTERELALERDLKRLQTRTSELEDENRTLKTPPTPAPVKPRDRWTFFDDD